jgi:hypothetical protein
MVGFLATTAACIDADGWKPAAMDYPTRAQVFDVLTVSGPYKASRNREAEPLPPVTPEHFERAEKALAWARAMSPDPVVNRDDYLRNLRLAVEPETVGSKRAGILVSLFGAYARAMEQEIKRVERERADGEAKPLPEFAGRAEIEGTIVSASWRETDFGMSLKIVVRHADGWRVWGSAPASLGSDEAALIGRRVRFSAAVDRSADKPSFGFFKRPTKAELLPAEGESAAA